MRRSVAAALFYAVSAVILAVASAVGLFPRYALWLPVATFTTAAVGFCIVIRSGFNLRFRDPSLTEAQIAIALLNCTLVLGFAGPMRGIVMLAYVVPLQFGAFALTSPILLRLCLIPALGLPIAVAAGQAMGIHGASINFELVQWLALMLVLPYTAVVAGRLHEYGRYKRLSDTDELSGLQNRRAALAYLDQLTRMSDANRVPFCVALMDFDHFKAVNDTFGHATGDQVIRSFAALARDTLRKGDVIARWGGEEFLVVLHGDLAQARASIERLIHAAANHSIEGLPRPVTVSAGLALHAIGQSIPDLVEHADRALYTAKRKGRNRLELAASDSDRRDTAAI
ncbi:GGDEF domain-containing protein [Niveibacterium umoris]|uniref:diguanylate cyclase n=1 Tax=Niveibacterium umoris TaxID=1193620 RepID=A0A840BD67_9RHOO|nr:GGDEF domain-containing protein [Niveibacterium umoris]MBB4011035.1 diguanylate cyclase (GGDEF)-like protein [Niveibacterium umoris]